MSDPTAKDGAVDAGGSIMSVSSGSSAATGWSNCADQYHRWAEHVTGPHALWMLERAMELDAVAQPKKRLEVLDLACGDGVLSLAAAERTDRVASVIASDYSAGMCAQLDRVLASRPASSPPLCPVRTLVADAQDLSSLATASVDLVLMGFGLMLVPDPARAVEEMRRVLRPGGILALASWDTSRSQLYGFMAQLVAHVHRRAAEREAGSSGSSVDDDAEPSAAAASLSDMPLQQLQEYRDIFAALDLKPVMLQAHTEQTGQFANAADFWQFLCGSLPGFQPPPARNAAEAAQHRAWACEFVDRLWGAEAPFRLSSVSLIAIAQKPATE